MYLVSVRMTYSGNSKPCLPPLILLASTQMIGGYERHIEADKHERCCQLKIEKHTLFLINQIDAIKINL